MTLRTRRILYSVFIIIFLIVTPAIWLYASGYKLGKGLELQKTGMLVIETKPKGARIFINNKVQHNLWRSLVTLKTNYIATPAKIKNLLPGEYVIRLEHDGYWNWSKRLVVESGRTTFIENVNLFRNDLPLRLDSGHVVFAEMSPNNRYLAVASDQGAAVIETNTENKTLLKFSSSTEEFTPTSTLAWSPNNRWLFVNGLLYEYENWNLSYDINELIGTNLKNIKWASNDDNHLYYRSGNRIEYYDIFQKTSHTLLNGGRLDDFLPKDNYLFYLEKLNQSVDLVIQNINDGNRIRSINLPMGDYRFINQKQALLNIYDEKTGTLYLIDPFSEIRPVKRTVTDVKNTHWIDSEKLLYSTEFEIRLLDLSAPDSLLLTRISDPVSAVFWHPNNNYVIFFTDKNIQILELDKRDKHNITKITQLKEIRFPSMSKRGDALYFYAIIGQHEGLYKLNIQ